MSQYFFQVMTEAMMEAEKISERGFKIEIEVDTLYLEPNPEATTIPEGHMEG